MMKKLLLTAFTGIIAVSAIGQACTPDPNYTPTSEVGAGMSDLPCAKINQPYDESATVVIPPSLPGDVVGLSPSITIYICNVKITSIGGIPANNGVNTPIVYKGVTYGLGSTITLDPAVDRACVAVQSPAFTALFNDSLEIFGTVGASLVGCPTVNLNYPIEDIGIKVAFTVDDDCLMGIEETMSNNSFDVSQNYPNPFNGETQIAYNLPEASKVTFRVTNLVGKTVKEVNMNGNYGVNYINISSAEYAAGVYMYSISANGKTVTKRMIVK